MKKKQLAFFIVTVVLGFAGCQKVSTTDVPLTSVTDMPTMEEEAIVEPTTESTATQKPTATPEPTATNTPVPTKAPVTT